ncbi:MAG: OmpA family protein [Crocinitomicaceae bacterium]
MSKKLAYLFGILITILFGTYFHWKYCCSVCCVSNEVIIIATSENETPQAIVLNGFNLNAEGIDFNCAENFNFKKDEFNKVVPFKDSILFGILKLKDYLYKFPDQKIVISGFAMNSETNSSAFPNLGLARANDVKNLLVEKGISPGQIKIQGELVVDLNESRKMILGPIDYSFVSKMEDEGSNINWELLKTTLNQDPLQLNFNSGASSIDLTEDQRAKIADISNYLDNVEGSTILIVGHTDNEGDRSENTALGLERAEFAKNYLARNGVNPARIDVDSKGPDEPIASNKTLDGRSKNRRTVVSIK